MHAALSDLKDPPPVYEWGGEQPWTYPENLQVDPDSENSHFRIYWEREKDCTHAKKEWNHPDGYAEDGEPGSHCSLTDGTALPMGSVNGSLNYYGAWGQTSRERLLQEYRGLVTHYTSF